MNIIELEDKLKKLNIATNNRMIANIWGMDEASYSRKKKMGTEIKPKNIEQIENAFKISLRTKVVENEVIEIDYYPNIEISCGSGVFPLSETKEKMYISPKVIKDYTTNSDYSIVKAVSDSMTPDIKPKDLLIVKHYQGEPIIDNHIYIFLYKDMLYCKYLSDNLGQIIVRSANADYPTRYISDEELESFKIIGEVKGNIREY